MRSLERHRDAGAYALGVLDEPDAFRFEDHLAQCPACHLALGELRRTADRLKLYGRATPPAAAPGPELLEHTLREVGRVHAVRRRRRLCALALAAVLAFGAPSVALVTAAGPDSGRPERLSARDARSGVHATLTARDRAWGTELALTVRDPAPRSPVCELVAVGKDGSERTVTTWQVPARRVEIPAVAALRPDETDRYEVRTADGERLVTLRP